jgi:hypothetical protein
MQLCCKHAFPTIEKEVIKGVQLRRIESSLETPACRDMSLGTEELN